MEDSLPTWVNRQLWFVSELCDGRDYLEETNPHTSPGHMGAYCPHRNESYSVTLTDLSDCSNETRIWARGFVIGNEPDPPDDEGVAPEDHPNYSAWMSAAEAYRTTGIWPPSAPTFRAPDMHDG
jgi:hypothetical protein